MLGLGVDDARPTPGDRHQDVPSKTRCHRASGRARTSSDVVCGARSGRGRHDRCSEGELGGKLHRRTSVEMNNIALWEHRTRMAQS